MSSPIFIVTVKALSRYTNTTGDGWDVEVSTTDRSSPCRLSQAFGTASDLQELRWFLEDFSSNNGSPFETARAAACSKRLNALAAGLHSQLELSELRIPDGAHVELRINSLVDDSAFFSHPWEILEDAYLFSPAAGVTLVRCFRGMGSGDEEEVHTDQLNLLVVTARPGMRKDIEYRLISQKIMDVVANLQDPAIPVYVEIVRPGTWAALTSCLERRRKEGLQFHILHMDVHGLVVAKGPRQGSYLTFLNQAGNGPHNKKASDVAKVLVDYGIRVVVMNACRSSSSITDTEGDAESSVAQVLIAAGVSTVLGMSYNISEGGAQVFVHQFYRQLLVHNRSLADAASGARAILYKDRKRNARFGLVVDVDDWIIPSLYVRDLVKFKRSPTAQQKRVRDVFGGLAGSLGQTFATEVVSGIERLQDRFRLLRVSNANTENWVQVLGRDFDIYTLENIFLLPFLRKGRPPINRRIIHMFGPAGIGKTTLLRHLLTWWKATHLVSESIYCDFTTLKNTADIFNEIRRQLFGTSRNASNLTMETVSQALREKRHLLVLDHLDAISAEMENDPTSQLAQFISGLAGGATFVLTASRNSAEGWLPNDAIWPLPLGRLAAQDAVQLIKAAAELSDDETRRLESRKETEAMTSLVDLCEGNPAALEWLGAYLKQTKMDPSTVLKIVQNGESKSAEVSKPSRFGKDLDAFFASLTAGITRFDLNSFVQFGAVIGLLPFQKRAPKDFAISYIYANWKMCEGSPLDWTKRYGVHVVVDLAVESNSVLMQRGYVRDFLRNEILELVSTMLSQLSQMHVVWSEKLTAGPTGSTLEEYWHIHPLFSLRLREYIARWVALVPEGPFMNYFRSAHEGFSQYYNKRAYDFDDYDIKTARESGEKMKFELDNFVTALYLWTTTKEASIFFSSALGCINQTFSLATLPRQQYRAVFEVLEHIIGHYRDTVTQPTDSSVHHLHRSHQVQNFLKAAETLQNMSVVSEDWASVRHYVRLIEAALDANPEAVESHQWIKSQRAQTNMVKGYEAFARYSFKEARQIFEKNLAEEPPADISAITRSGYLKIRFMNLNGLLKCKTQERDYSIGAMYRDFQTLQNATTDWTSTLEGLTTAHGWHDHNTYMNELMRNWGGFMGRLNESSKEDGTSVEVTDIVSDLQNLLQQIESAPMRQSALKTLHTSLANGNAIKQPKNLSSALLSGLADAYGDQVADAGLAKYYQELTGILIQGDSNYGAALQVHARWVQLRRTNEGIVDKHVALVDEYVYAVCYFFLGQHAKSERHCQRALGLAEETRVDKTGFACFHIAAYLELHKGHFTSAFRYMCRAGALAYAEDNDTGYDRKGSIMQIMFTIGCLAMGLVEHEDVPSSMQPILIAPQVQLQSPAQLTSQDQGREKKQPREVLQEFIATAAEILGPVRTFTLLGQVGLSPMKFMKGDKIEDIAWAELEDLLFGNATVPLRRESSLAQFSPGVQNVEQERSERELRRTLTDGIAPIQRTISFEIEDAAEVGKSVQALAPVEQDPESFLPALKYMMKLSSSLRDTDQRTVLWHFSAGQQCDMDAVAALGIRAQDLPPDCLTGDGVLAFVKLLLQLGANLALFDRDGRTPFMRAVETGNFDIADLLLEHGADQDYKNFADETALHEAVQRQDAPAVDYCISHGCSLVARNLKGETALGMAVIRESKEICVLLLCAGANPLTRDYIGRSCLRLALEFARYDNFKPCITTLYHMPGRVFMDVLLDYGYTNQNLYDLILEAKDFDRQALDLFERCSDMPGDLTRRDKAGVTCFHRAAMSLTPQLVHEFFVKTRADWTIQDDCYGLTPLHFAVINSDPMGMLSVLMNEGEVKDVFKDHIMNKKAIKMLAWNGLTMNFGSPDTEFHHTIKMDGHKSLSLKYFLSFVEQCRLRYVRPLSQAEVDQLVEFRRTLAFGPGKESEGPDASVAAFRNATIDLVYGSEAAENAGSSATFSSQAAERLHNCQKLFSGVVEDNTTDDMCQLRWSIPWRFNSRRFPHVFYMDRNGTCQYTEPLYEREDPVYRVWVVDEYGVVKGVLGAVAM